VTARPPVTSSPTPRPTGGRGGTGQGGTFEILYPEHRHVGVEWVLSQGFDAKVNDAVAAHVREHGPFADDDGAYEAFVARIAAPDLDESIAFLEDLGFVTFARARGRR
jgi:hypothetical protein